MSIDWMTYDNSTAEICTNLKCTRYSPTKLFGIHNVDVDVISPRACAQCAAQFNYIETPAFSELIPCHRLLIALTHAIDFQFISEYSLNHSLFFSFHEHNNRQYTDALRAHVSECQSLDLMQRVTENDDKVNYAKLFVTSQKAIMNERTIKEDVENKISQWFDRESYRGHASLNYLYFTGYESIKTDIVKKWFSVSSMTTSETMVHRDIDRSKFVHDIFELNKAVRRQFRAHYMLQTWTASCLSDNANFLINSQKMSDHDFEAYYNSRIEEIPNFAPPDDAHILCFENIAIQKLNECYKQWEDHESDSDMDDDQDDYQSLDDTDSGMQFKAPIADIADQAQLDSIEEDTSNKSDTHITETSAHEDSSKPDSLPDKKTRETNNDYGCINLKCQNKDMPKYFYYKANASGVTRGGICSQCKAHYNESKSYHSWDSKELKNDYCLQASKRLEHQLQFQYISQFSYDNDLYFAFEQHNDEGHTKILRETVAPLCIQSEKNNAYAKLTEKLTNANKIRNRVRDHIKESINKKFEKIVAEGIEVNYRLDNITVELEQEIVQTYWKDNLTEIEYCTPRIFCLDDLEEKLMDRRVMTMGKIVSGLLSRNSIINSNVHIFDRRWLRSNTVKTCSDQAIWDFMRVLNGKDFKFEAAQLLMAEFSHTRKVFEQSYDKFCFDKIVETTLQNVPSDERKFEWPDIETYNNYNDADRLNLFRNLFIASRKIPMEDYFDFTEFRKSFQTLYEIDNARATRNDVIHIDS